MSELPPLWHKRVLTHSTDDVSDLRKAPAKDLDFGDSDDDGHDEGKEVLPTGQHMFDLDAMPSDEDGEDDEFDLGEGEDDDDLLGDEDDDEMMDSDAEEEDSAFASSGDEDEMEVDEANDPRTAHLRLNPEPGSDDEDGAITTNLEDDLTNEGFTLPAVDNGGEVEDFEHGTSLREIETRMRWLVGVCAGKDEKLSEGVPGK
jgi:ribosomal RNA methyltransferase Nop2